MGTWTNNALFAETSRNLGRITPAELAGFDGLICKLGGSDNAPNADPYPGYTERVKNPYWDDELDFSIQSAYDAPNPDGTKGIPCGVSYTIGPRVYTEAGLDSEDYASVPNDRHPVIKILVDRLRLGSRWKAVHFVIFYIVDSSLAMSGGYQISPKDIAAYIDDVRSRIIELRKSGGFPNIPFGFYSRKSLIEMIDARDAQNPHVRTWFENKTDCFLSTANFPGVGSGAIDAATIREKHLPADGAKPLVWGYSPKRETPDAEYPLWSFWNFAPAGRPHRFGLKLFNGTRTQLWAWLKFKQTTPPVPPDPEIPPVDAAELGKRVSALEEWRASAIPIIERADRHVAG